MPLMREPSGLSIRRWLLWVLSASLVGLMLAYGWTRLLTTESPIDAAFDHALLDDAYAVAAHIRTTPQGILFEMEERAADVLRIDPDDDFYFLVRGPKGEFLGGNLDLPIPIGVLAEKERIFEAEYRGEPIRGILLVQPTSLGDVAVYAAQTLRVRQSIQREAALGILLSSALLVALTLAVVYLVVGAGLRPLLRLSNELEGRGSDLLTPVSVRGLPSELLPLAGALNQLLRTIDTSTRAQRRFLADASHQLRTPLAGLQGQLELLVHEDLPDAVHKRIEDLHLATRRLSHLSSRLLELGRSDASADPSLEMETVNLDSVVEACASEFLDRALAKEIDLGFEAEPAAVVGNLWMVREMANNLIDNAIAYTPAGGRITVRSGVLEGHPTLEVEDDGPGIPLPERERVFSRFYRLRQDDGIGCGLGLAIVRQIAEAHHADVSILDTPARRGALFRVRFPVPSQSSPMARAGPDSSSQTETPHRDAGAASIGTLREADRTISGTVLLPSNRSAQSLTRHRPG